MSVKFKTTRAAGSSWHSTALRGQPPAGTGARMQAVRNCYGAAWSRPVFLFQNQKQGAFNSPSGYSFRKEFTERSSEITEVHTSVTTATTSARAPEVRRFPSEDSRESWRGVKPLGFASCVGGHECGPKAVQAGGAAVRAALQPVLQLPGGSHPHAYPLPEYFITVLADVLWHLIAIRLKRFCPSGSQVPAQQFQIICQHLCLSRPTVTSEQTTRNYYLCMKKG